MSKLWRTNLVAFGLCVLAFASGCDKKASSGAAVPGGPTAPPKADAALYPASDMSSSFGGMANAMADAHMNRMSESKKLIGTWEGTVDVGEGKTGQITTEFKGDGSFKSAMGPFEMKGTWKLVKEEGKAVTVSTEVAIVGIGDPSAPPKMNKLTFQVVFEDANTVVMSEVGGKPDPIKLKRKS